MKIHIPDKILSAIQKHGQNEYPEEGAGLLLGKDNGSGRAVEDILPLTNSREDGARRNRYLITSQDMLHGEQEAANRGLDIVGVFHSHPDHPSQPSEFDKEWALPWYSYLITSVDDGIANTSRSWRLSDDRKEFNEETILVTKASNKTNSIGDI